ncbi:MAG TPA: histidine kinase [Desulfobacteraceae bacterium]|nr:histidine kinase [Desulfobacteraceae bacterium]
MWKRIGLRSRIFLLLVALVTITVCGGAVMVWYTYRMQGLVTGMIHRHVEAFQAAEMLQTALSSQKGFVSYYLLDGDPEWLKSLGEHRQIFKEKLRDARLFATNEEQGDLLDKIETETSIYVAAKDRVISLYKSGESDEGARLHAEVRNHFDRINDLCRELKNFYTVRLEDMLVKTKQEAVQLRVIAGTAIILVLILALSLAFTLIHQILGPLRRLAYETDREGGLTDEDNEVKALSRSVRGLIEDFDFTHSELERSRETLIQAEKMAMVGKLAAGMAHSIRNPLTSVKMRLFSLKRSLELTVDQQEDFDVIYEEIRHTDTIVQNFLEFSRPPKLQIQTISPSEIVDFAVQLMAHRIESYGVRLDIKRNSLMPPVAADPEQLKEVIVNIIVNACEAMQGGGRIVIAEELGFDEKLGDAVYIHIEDNGPGISPKSRHKVLQPFFTTKEEGTGLGLSIAVRIVEEHKGRLTFKSKEFNGTTFTIVLPVKG